MSITLFQACFITGLMLNKEYNLEESKHPQSNIVSRIKIEYSFFDILSNNFIAALYILSGGFLFGIPTFIVLSFNSYSIGSLIDILSTKYNYKIILILLLPHGFLEIPAIIIAGAAGFKIPYEVVRYLLGRKEQVLTKEDIEEYLTLALVSIILIVIAAWIEANVTLKIAKAMLSTGI